MAGPDVKECRSLGLPETTSMNIQPCVLCFVSSSVQLFSTDVLEDMFGLNNNNDNSNNNNNNTNKQFLKTPFANGNAIIRFIFI